VQPSQEMNFRMRMLLQSKETAQDSIVHGQVLDSLQNNKFKIVRI